MIMSVVLNHSSEIVSIPRYFNFCESLLWLILSKHFSISRKHITHKSPSSIYSHKSSTTRCKHVTVECFFKYADCYGVINAWASKYSINCLWPCFSKILPHATTPTSAIICFSIQWTFTFMNGYNPCKFPVGLDNPRHLKVTATNA